MSRLFHCLKRINSLHMQGKRILPEKPNQFVDPLSILENRGQSSAPAWAVPAATIVAIKAGRSMTRSWVTGPSPPPRCPLCSRHSMVMPHPRLPHKYEPSHARESTRARRRQPWPPAEAGPQYRYLENDQRRHTGIGGSGVAHNGPPDKLQFYIGRNDCACGT